MDVAGLLESNISAIGVLLVVLIALIFDLGIVTKGRLTDANSALAESEKRADAAELRAETERKENTDTIVRAAAEISNIRQEMAALKEESRKLHSSAETAIKTQNQLMKQMGAVLLRAGIKPPEEEKNPWGS